MANKQNYVVVSIGSYAPSRLMVSPEVAGKLLPLLAGCWVVSEEWDGKDHHVVESSDGITMKTTEDAPMSKASFESIRAAVRAEKEAEAAAKE